MTRTPIRTLVASAMLAAAAITASATAGATSTGTEFTYQGQLKFEGELVNGLVDLEFQIWSEAVGGFANAAPVTKLDVSVTNGLFTTEIDFGYGLTDTYRWLEIDVRSPAGGGAFVTLPTRQRLSMAPFALQVEGIQVNSTSIFMDRRLRVPVLTIVGGSDIAEPFKIESSIDIKPGMVVSIHPKKIGELRLATAAYDTTVAGIISGAGGIRPGMTLTQEGTIADGEHPVALTGRVWCWCDADANGPILAGSMLTTATTPGHAMAATDRDRAFGATIGKAMSPLESGRGLVLVLVNLQ